MTKTTSTPTAKDFTMASKGADIYQNPFHAFDWIMEGDSEEGLAMADSVEQFVRDWAKFQIETWRMYGDGEGCRASAETIYRTWRTGDEFDLIVRYIRDNYAS